MRHIAFIFLSLLYTAETHGQSNSASEHDPNARFVGVYQSEGGTIQFAQQKEGLVLVVPGAPIQRLLPAGKNRFQSAVFKDQYFAFTEDKGSVTDVICEDKRGDSGFKKINGNAKILSAAMDSLLVLKKSTEHFLFRYTDTDAKSIDSLALDMEKNYTRILNDFNLKSIPAVTVRIYPDLKSFHKGINFPDAPDQILATAFGKDDVRLVSPKNAGPEGWMLVHFAPHEFTHCVHLNVDYSPNNPRWLWEGVAQYESRWFFDPKEIDSIRNKQFPAFADLNNGMEYMLGFVIIEAIKDLWGFEKVIDLIKTQGDVQKVLHMDEKTFEEKIYAHIFEKYVK